MPPAAFLDALFSLTGKVAVVAGGTGELCGTMAEGLAGAGAEVVIVGAGDGVRSVDHRSPFWTVARWYPRVRPR